MVKKHLIGLFLDKGTTGTPDWFRIKKSTALTITMNGEVVENDYIADESPTSELNKYAPAIDQDLTMIKGEPDYEFVFDKFFSMATGTEAHVDCMVVFMQEGDNETGFKSWKTNALLTITDMNAVDSKINFSLTFGGTTVKGTAKMVDGVPTFEEAA